MTVIFCLAYALASQGQQAINKTTATAELKGSTALTIYHQVTAVNIRSTFVNEFRINKDSVCFYNAGYKDNSQFMLYKGRLTKINDTLYEFNYRPLVEFFCNERFIFKTADSIHMAISQQDTLLTSLRFSVNLINATVRTVDLSHNMAYVKGASDAPFVIDTKFINPLTSKKIYMTVDPPSEPELVYYGSNSAPASLEVCIKKNYLRIYGGQKYIWRDALLKIYK